MFVGILRGMLMEGCFYVYPEWNWNIALHVGTWMVGQMLVHSLKFINPGPT